jgi:hypothetical protein
MLVKLGRPKKAEGYGHALISDKKTVIGRKVCTFAADLDN